LGENASGESGLGSKRQGKKKGSGPQNTRGTEVAGGVQVDKGKLGRKAAGGKKQGRRMKESVLLGVSRENVASQVEYNWRCSYPGPGAFDRIERGRKESTKRMVEVLHRGFVLYKGLYSTGKWCLTVSARECGRRIKVRGETVKRKFTGAGRVFLFRVGSNRRFSSKLSRGPQKKGPAGTANRVETR